MWIFLSHDVVHFLDQCRWGQVGKYDQKGNKMKQGECYSLVITSPVSVNSKETRTCLRKLMNKLKHFIFNLQIIQLHQVWSHRNKEQRHNPSLKHILKHFKLNSLHLTVAAPILYLPSQWTPSESRSFQFLLVAINPKGDWQLLHM